MPHGLPRRGMLRVLQPAETCITSFCDFTCPIIGQSNVCGLPHEETTPDVFQQRRRPHGELDMGIKPQIFPLSQMCEHVILTTIFRCFPYLNLIEIVAVVV